MQFRYRPSDYANAKFKVEFKGKKESADRSKVLDARPKEWQTIQITATPPADTTDLILSFKPEDKEAKGPKVLFGKFEFFDGKCPPAEAAKGGGMRLWIKVLIGILVVAALVIGGFFIYCCCQNKNST